MCWNDGKERKLFEKRQAVLAKQYRLVGMTEEQIQQMYEFDLAEYRSERIFNMHTQAMEINFADDDDVGEVSNYLLECQTECFRNYSNRYWWVDELERLYSVVKTMSDAEKELITLYVFDGYTQKEISQIRNCDQATISRQINKIKNKLLAAQGGEKNA